MTSHIGDNPGLAEWYRRQNARAAAATQERSHTDPDMDPDEFARVNEGAYQHARMPMPPAPIGGDFLRNRARRMAGRPRNGGESTSRPDAAGYYGIPAAAKQR